MGSSSRTSGAFESAALARVRRARCPADRPNPSSPSRVSRLCARAATMPSSPTSRSMSQSSSSVLSLPRVRLSLTVPVARNGRWVTRCERGAETVPASGRRSPASSSRRVDLPAPDGPVTTVSPIGRSRHIAQHVVGRARSGIATPSTTAPRIARFGVLDRPETRDPRCFGRGWRVGVALWGRALGWSGRARRRRRPEPRLRRGGVELRADTRRTRPIGLWRKENGQHGGVERHRAVGQPDAHRHGDERHRDGERALQVCRAS